MDRIRLDTYTTGIQPDNRERVDARQYGLPVALCLLHSLHGRSAEAPASSSHPGLVAARFAGCLFRHRLLLPPPTPLHRRRPRARGRRMFAPLPRASRLGGFTGLFHARSRAFVRRADAATGAIARGVHASLEELRDVPAGARTNLAGRVFRSFVAVRRERRAEVGIRAAESGPRGIV